MTEVANRKSANLEVVENSLTEDLAAQKLKMDLDAVTEKITLCREVLQESPGIQEDELLSDLVGFLEACRDRLVDVLEAGSQGLLSEDLFAYALKVNDSLLKTLEAEWTGTKIEVVSVKKASEEPSLLELDSPFPPTPTKSKVLATTPPTMVDDLDLLTLGPVTNITGNNADPFSSTPAVMPPAPPANQSATTANTHTSAAAAQSAVDDFDSFFESLK